jgi:hypothetical protein
VTRGESRQKETEPEFDVRVYEEEDACTYHMRRRIHAHTTGRDRTRV